MNDYFEVFFTPNEYTSGYKYIMSMLICGIKPIIWAPSFKYLESQSNETILTPSLLIDFVEAGYIKIAARKKWLLDQKFRDNYKWAPAHWDDDYDSVIRKFVKNNNPFIFPISEPDSDRDIRKLFLNKRERIRICKQVWNFYKKKIPPPGQLRRIDEKNLLYQDEIVKQIIFDTYNTEDAMKGFGGPKLVTTPETVPLMECLFRGSGNQYNKPSNNNTNIAEFIEILSEVLKSNPVGNKGNVFNHIRKWVEDPLANKLGHFLSIDKTSLDKFATSDLNKIKVGLGRLLKRLNINPKNTLSGLVSFMNTIKNSNEKNTTIGNFIGSNTEYLIIDNDVNDEKREELISFFNKVKTINIKRNHQYQPIHIFICYRSAKQKELKELKELLKDLVDDRIVDIFCDRNIMAGNIIDQICPAIEICDIAIMIISSDLKKSDTILNYEIPKIFNRVSEKKCSFIPILYSKRYSRKKFIKDIKGKKIDLSGELLDQFLFLPKDGLPVYSWKNIKDAMEDIKKRLHKHINEIIEGKHIERYSRK